MATVLPIVTVYDDDGTTLTTLAGPNAIADAEAFIGRMADAYTGRYGISVSDDQCPACDATFSREAWDDHPLGWSCPKCGTVDTRK